MIEIKTTQEIVKECAEFNEDGLGLVCCSRAWDKWVSLESVNLALCDILEEIERIALGDEETINLPDLQRYIVNKLSFRVGVQK